jgi:hypothetical protein
VPNGVSIRDYFEKLFVLHAHAHAEHNEAHTREHKASQDAIDLAAKLASQNKSDANEWRAAMTDRERTFVKYDLLDGLISRVTKLENSELTRFVRDEERGKQQSRTMTLIGAAAAIGGFILSLLARLFNIV